MYTETDITINAGDTGDLFRTIDQLPHTGHIHKSNRNPDEPVCNKALIRDFFCDINSGVHSSNLAEYFSDQYVDHSKFRNFNGVRRILSDYRRVYSDISISVVDILAERDEVVARIDVRPTRNKKISSVSAIIVFRLENGKISESWAHSDSFF